jgi:hypothetical protein
MTLETRQWAEGLRASLIAQIDAVLASGVSNSQHLERVVTLRRFLEQVESLIAALESVDMDR